MNPPAGLTELENLFNRIISISVGLAFIALIAVLVFAGIKFITSGGEAKALQSTSLTVTWALLGILFLAIAWLVLLLIQNFTGINVTLFDLKTQELCGIAVGGILPWCP